jgi:hypothetical protein
MNTFARRSLALPKAEQLGPPLTPEELTGSLSELERKLNRAATCPAAKNQVYIRSVIVAGATSRPRLSLKCNLRRDVKQTPDVFYEHIRDYCCGNHEQCPAYQAFAERRGNL